MRAQKVGKKVAVFNKINEFLQIIDVYDKNVQIYIDSDLNDKLKGEIFARELYEKGFKQIYLATSYEKDSFESMHWIAAIVDKEPPF